jgi:CheY-like chemotaxis protein/two-component sensor histidine kinase
MEVSSVRFTELRDFCSRTFRHVAEGKGLDFSIEVGENIFAENIITDAKRLQQILKNLLSNALKFTEHGAVRLRVDRVSSGWSTNHAVLNRVKTVIAFSVTDSGIGIPQDKQRIIFEAFQQADGTTSRKYGGTGLGLTISREIARLLGGTIKVESAPGEGSTFTLVIPDRYAGPEPVVRMPVESILEDLGPVIVLPVDADFTGKTILLADDDIRNVFAINSVLESRKMRVLHAENGKDAIRLLEENPAVDLVLMDTMMPEMDGLTAIQEIRKRSTFERLPIISLTAKAMKGDREKSIDAGASDYIAKPVDPDRLLAVIHGWLQPGAQRASR